MIYKIEKLAGTQQFIDNFKLMEYPAIVIDGEPFHSKMIFVKDYDSEFLDQNTIDDCFRVATQNKLTHVHCIILDNEKVYIRGGRYNKIPDQLGLDETDEFPQPPADLDDEDYRHFICLEVANAAADSVEILPQGEYRIDAHYSLVD